MEEVLFPGVFIAAVVPIVLILTAAYHQQRVLRSVLIRRERESGMSDEMMKNLIGKRCTFSTFLFGETFKNVDVVAVDGNWIRLTDGKRERLVNGDYVTSVRIVGEAGER